VTKVDPALIDVFFPHDGYPEELAKEDTRENMKGAAEEAGAVVTDFPEGLWIEPSQWAEIARQNTEYKSWGMDYLDRFTNQNPTHECTCHSLRANMEAAWNRSRRISFGGPVAGKRLEQSAKSGSVWLSPLSVYAEAQPRQWGGANVQQVLRIAAKRGMLPEPIQPRDYGFKHTLHGTTGKGGVNQAKGPWVKLSNFPDGWEETAKHFKPLEFIFPDSIEQAVSLLLHGFLVSVGRKGHAIPWGKFDPDEKLFPYTDSYDVIRYDSWSTARGCAGNGSFSIVSVTTPDDWDKPAG
jgi:hypothetical protein